jgi:hypothetical protein
MAVCSVSAAVTHPPLPIALEAYRLIVHVAVGEEEDVGGAVFSHGVSQPSERLQGRQEAAAAPISSHCPSITASSVCARQTQSLSCTYTEREGGEAGTHIGTAAADAHAYIPVPRQTCKRTHIHAHRHTHRHTCACLVGEGCGRRRAWRRWRVRSGGTKWPPQSQTA